MLTILNILLKQSVEYFQAFLGVLLFHTLFIVSPKVGINLFGDAQLGEYFRTFVAYGVIGVSLGLHAWKTMLMKRQE